MSSPRLAGRTDELKLLVEALATPPVIAFVEGEAGIGKTRLIRECLRSPELVDRRLLVAVCPPLTEPFPLGPVVDGIRRLRPRLDDVDLSPLAGALRPLFPEWADQLPPASEPLDDPAGTRHRLMRALTELINRLGVEVLVVEDAHWADTATLEWLLTLTTAGELDMGVVVTFRPTEVPDRSPLLRLTSRPAADVARVRIELAPLDLAETRDLVRSMLATDQVSAELAGFLHARTDGVPLAVEETVRLLRDRHDVVGQHGTWTRERLDELDVPPTLRDSILERVSRLDPEARAVLQAAAILGEPAEQPLLTGVADLDETAGRRCVATALASGLLREARSGRLVFRHVLDAQAVAEAIPASERWHLHRRAAEHLQRLRPEPVVRLARHFREAGDAEQWCHYAEAAAALAWESGDDHTAVTTLRDLLTTANHATDRRTRLARKLGEYAFFGAGALRDLAEQVVRLLRDVLDIDELDRGERGEFRLLLGRMLWQAGAELAAFEEMEAAVPDLDDRPDLAIEAMSNLGLALIPEWTVERHRYWLGRAAELAEQAGSSADRQAFVRMRPSALLYLGEEAGWQAISEIPTPPTGSPEQRRVAPALLNVALAAMVWGRYDDTRRQLDVVAEHVEESGLTRLVNDVRMAWAQLDWYTGAWTGLKETAQELAAAEDVDPIDRLQARQLVGLLKMAGGGRSVAERHLRAVVDEYARLGVAEPMAVLGSAGLGRLSLADGDAAGALQATGRAVDMIVRKGIWLWATDVAPVHFAALIGAGLLDEAKDLVEKLASGIAGRDAPAPAAALATCRAILAEAHDDPADAAARFAEAADAWARLPRPYDELLARERQGRCLLAADRHEQAVAVLSEAERRLRGLGAKWDADRVAHQLRQQGIEVTRTWRRGPRGYGERLSPRELEVVALVARGMTNKQIAETLYLSPRTVGRHLSSSMRKLNASSRTGVAMAAAEAGLLPVTNGSS